MPAPPFDLRLMHNIDWDLLHRYLSGEGTLEERAHVETWRDASPERQAFIHALLRETAELPALPLLTERDRTETWARLERTIAGQQEAVPAARRSLRSGSRHLFYSAIAATLALVLGVAAVRGGLVRTQGSAATATAATATSVEHTLRAPRGQRATFQLPDGTRVVLGPSSTLRYAVEYGRRLREVRLQGEAYFAVVHDAQRPFKVFAADLVAQDLGTEFTVRAYPEDAGAVVAVREGEVGIRAVTAVDATVRVVAAGEVGRLSGQGEPLVVAADLDRYFAWTEGKLVFDEVPLREVLPEVSRWFDLDLRISDSALGSIPVSAVLDQRPTADVLANMAAALGLVSVRDGQVVYFRRPALEH